MAAAPGAPCAAPSPPPWRWRWLAWRNRLLANPGFQRMAAAFWPTRAVAHARAAELFDLVGGFVYSQILLACVRLRLFDVLAGEPVPTAVVAAQTGLAEEAAVRLLDAACALRLVERAAPGCWTVGVLGAPLVGNAALHAMVEHHALLYADLADPVALLRGKSAQQLPAYWAYARATDSAALPSPAVHDYSRLMSASQPLVAGEVLEAYPFQRHHRVLDVGGGDGTFLQALGLRHPALRRMLFDLPAVVDLAAGRLRGGVELHGGDFTRDELPAGADVVTLVRVLHDHDDAVVLDLLARVRRCLPPGGHVVVAEPMAGTRGARTMGDAYFGFYMLAMGSGRPRTPERLSLLLAQSGFGCVRQHRTRFPLQASVVSAQSL